MDPLLRVVLLLPVLAGCAGEPLEAAMSRGALLAHLQALQQIADDNDGNRSAFSQGYADSAAYVADQLDAAGYDVQLEPFTVDWPSIDAAALSQVAPETIDYAWAPADGTGFSLWPGSPGIDLTAGVVPVDLVLPPGAAPDTSTSGCEASDYAGFPEGAIALVQRGTCPFVTKDAIAAGAGAAAIVVFNEGQPGRTERIDGSFFVTDTPSVPFFFVDYDTGASLAPAAAAGTLRMHVLAAVTFTEVTDHDVLADTPGGDPARTILVGAHLDSVTAGPGINDNGSGSALVLELARQVAETGLHPRNRIRFAWWGAEELGLVGSSFYVQAHGLGAWAAFNYDMVASPNGLPFVYGGDWPAAGYQAPPGSTLLEEAVAEWYDGEGLSRERIPAAIASDSYLWATGGVPVGGLYTGGTETLTEQAAALYGGTPGQPMDACYHRACDTLDHLDPDRLEQSARAAAHALHKLARWSGPLE